MCNEKGQRADGLTGYLRNKQHRDAWRMRVAEPGLEVGLVVGNRVGLIVANVGPDVGPVACGIFTCTGRARKTSVG